MSSPQIPTASTIKDSVVVSSSQRDSVAEVEGRGTTRNQTRSGGVPVFVQERIDEKLRKRSESDLIKSPDHAVSLRLCKASETDKNTLLLDSEKQKNDLLRSNYCVLASVFRFCRFYCCKLITPRKCLHNYV